MNVDELQKLLQVQYHLRDHGAKFKNIRAAVDKRLDEIEAEATPKQAPAPEPPKATPAPAPEPEEDDEIERRV